MRSTSSGRRATALLLCAALLAPGGPGNAGAAEPPSPALLLKFAGAAIPEDLARERLGALGPLLRRELRVSWVDPQASPARPPAPGPLPEAAEAEIEEIDRALAEAARRMEGMETEAAARRLDEAERIGRSRRPDGVLRPYLAEIFLRRGLLRLWEGNVSGAEEMFVRARALRPDFIPDPALYSPAFRETWARSASRPAPGADLLIRSLPPGAEVAVDGQKRGVTPARIRVPALAPIRIRVAMPGHVAEERAGRWLPGDSEAIDISLRRDPVLRLEELLASSPAGGTEAAGILSALAGESGAERVAVLVLAGEAARPLLRVIAMDREGGEPILLGEIPWGEEGADIPAARAAALLSRAGWPASDGSPASGRGWYRRWWIWALLAASLAGAAAALSGGGGSGDSAGAINVNF